MDHSQNAQHDQMAFHYPPSPMDLFGVLPFPWFWVTPLLLPPHPPTFPIGQDQPLDLSITSWKSEMSAAASHPKAQTAVPPPYTPTSSVGISPSNKRLMSPFPFGTLDQNMVCPFCRKEFRFEKNLLRHMQKAHATGTGESVLKCKLCPYTTRHYSNMYVHIRTHTGDKPYSCAGCGSSFTQGSSLKLHIKSRHGDNMALFSLFRKPGKNNLTKLWTRVLTQTMTSDPTGTMPSLLPPYHQALPLPQPPAHQSPSGSSTTSGYSSLNESTPMSRPAHANFSIDSLTSPTRVASHGIVEEPIGHQ